MYLNLDQLEVIMSAPSVIVCPACNLFICACATLDYCGGCCSKASECECEPFAADLAPLDDYFPTACWACGQMDLACECIDLRFANIL